MMKFSFGNDAMAQRAIERSIGAERKHAARVEVSAMVADYAARNGIRRFSDGDSGSYDAVCSYLLSRGYQVKYMRNRYEVKKIVELADEVRTAEGREPLKRRAA